MNRPIALKPRTTAHIAHVTCACGTAWRRWTVKAAEAVPTSTI